jgi:hypothetical protein
MTVPPVLHALRLTLRAPDIADFPDPAAFLATPRAEDMGGPRDTRDAWGEFCHRIAGRQLSGHCGPADLRNDTGESVAMIEPDGGPLFPETEPGWQFCDSREDQGLATGAAMALRDRALARRLGAVVDPDVPGQDEGDVVWRHLRAQQ